MMIDAHQHFWNYDAARDAWITDDMAVLQKDFRPADLHQELLANHFDGCVAVQAAQSESETQFLLELAAAHSFIKGVVGWVDLRADNVAARLDYFSQFDKLCGFRHIVQAEPDDDFLWREDFRRGIALLNDYHFTYDILIYPQQLPAAIRFVEPFPEQRFVLDHLAKPFIKDRKIDPWAAQIRELAKHPNLYCKVSGMVTEANWQNWHQDDFTPYLDVVFDAFGADKIMYGSDWPVCLLAANYATVFGLVADYAKSFSAADRVKIFGLNATRFYQLKG
ncbi:MAG: amidohydrolase family protein [Acidobacteria bacterium]|nr:amidohydrolase family protein [Acidobacteriota bacterium]